MPFLPDLPALVAGHGRAVLMTGDGEFVALEPGAAAKDLAGDTPLVVHGPATLRRLGNPNIQVLDILELFAFVLPARGVAPSPAGLARSFDTDPPPSLEAAASSLAGYAEALLTRLATAKDLPANRDAAGLAARMGAAGWGWAPFVLAALGQPAAKPDGMAMRLWKRLPEWEEAAPRPPPAAFPVPAAEARARLAALLGTTAEQRPAQADYASAAAAAFNPRAAEGVPHLVLAEAGTGTGKTLGYLAPASVWAEHNQGAVWVSTYTRHLQRQIESEASRLGKHNEQRQRVVLRKGRENYLCLLNYEDAANVERHAVPLGLIARWAAASADGDLMGGDLPGWFAELFGHGLLASIADRRGECIHAACPHYKRCVIEHVIRRARLADLVIANHALVMAQAVWGGLDDDYVPTRYVFDEGHHIFDAADSAFSVELSGGVMAELRRWLLGAEGTRSRARGLARRLEDILATDESLMPQLDAALIAARALPAPLFTARLEADLADPEAPKHPAEAFLRALRAQARARAGTADLAGTMPIEVDLYPIEDAVVETGIILSRAMERLRLPLTALRARFLDRLETEAETLEETTRQRLEGAARSLKRRAIDPLAAWQRMLDGLGAAPPTPGERPSHIYLLRLDRDGSGADRDVAFLSHLLDPTEAFIQTIAAPAHGLLVTSATLRDGATHAGLGEAETELAWEGAEARTGAKHLATPAIRAAFASPFDYAAQTRICIVNDVNITEIGTLAGAFRALFMAAGGGGLGLFTAISRLRAVHARIALPLEAAGIPLVRPACRRHGQRHPGRHLPGRGTIPACSAPMRCATASIFPATRCAWWCSSVRPGPGPTSCTAPAAPISPTARRRITTTPSSACACARPSAG